MLIPETLCTVTKQNSNGDIYKSKQMPAQEAEAWVQRCLREYGNGGIFEYWLETKEGVLHEMEQ